MLTSRLELDPLCIEDADFIQELVNTPEWVEFIGERNVHNPEDARAYIERILGNPDVQYWVVKLVEDGTQTGVVTLIQRSYLENQDIGFAFLPRHTRNGFAFEAASAVLEEYWATSGAPKILATTVTHNVKSIALLGRLGFSFDREIEQDSTVLRVYSREKDA